jgi:hypothetical protein
MNKQITNKQLDLLEGFIGYGKKNAEIIFFGIEEGGGGYENLKMRFSMDKYEYLDCKKFHLDNLKVTRFHNEDEKHSVELQQVWKFMSYLMLRYKGHSKKKILDNNRQLLREYQNNRLGTTNEKGETLLTELFPIPCDSDEIWGTKNESYTKIIPQYKSKKDYRQSILPLRKKKFQNLINSTDFSASVIICYGKRNWKEFEKFFNGFNVKFQEINTSKECKMGILKDDIKVFLTPFFGNGQMGYEGLDELEKFLK